MTPAQETLIAAAKAMLVFHDRRSRGVPMRGMYEDLAVGRELAAAIADVEREARQPIRETVQA